MKQFNVSIQVKTDRVRRMHLLPWVLRSFDVLARDPQQAIEQAKVRANLLGLTTNEVFMCTPVEAA